MKSKIKFYLIKFLIASVPFMASYYLIDWNRKLFFALILFKIAYDILDFDEPKK